MSGYIDYTHHTDTVVLAWLLAFACLMACVFVASWVAGRIDNKRNRQLIRAHELMRRLRR